MATEIVRARLEVYPTPLFYEWVDRGKFNALDHIQIEYDGILDYHIRRHSESVVTAAPTILWVIRQADPSLVPFRQVKLIELPASSHDNVQQWRLIGGKRIMLTGENEEASANLLRSFMMRANEEEKRSVFSTEDIELSAGSILATKPDFDGPRVLQPGLTKNSPPFTIALCLADLSWLTGRDPDGFIDGINALFREVNVDIATVLKNGWPSQAQEADFRERMIEWTECQIEFAKHRKENVPEQIQGLPPSAQRAVIRLFNSFDESIGMVTKLAKDRKEMPFDELVRSFSFKLLRASLG